MDEIEKANWNGNSIDHILSNIYQKMILKFGQPHGIDLTGVKPKVVFFVGPTGVGKTTTLENIAIRRCFIQFRKNYFIVRNFFVDICNFF